MKKVLCFSALLFIFCVLRITPAAAISIDFIPANQTANVGDSLSVDVSISGLLAAGEIVSTFDLAVSYDSSVLFATGVSFGGFLDDMLFGGATFNGSDVTTTAGTVEFFELSFLTDDELALQQPDSFVLATLSFDAIAEGISPLSFLEGTIIGVPGLDVKGRNAAVLLNLNGGIGDVTVLANAVPEPATLWLLLSGIMVGGYFQRSRTACTKRATCL